MTFSLSPRNSSTTPPSAASVNTFVVSWNDADEMNDSLDRLALVIPSNNVVAEAGLGFFPLADSPPDSSTSSFTATSSALAMMVPSDRSESPGLVITTLLLSFSFSVRNLNLSTISPGRNLESPGLSTFTFRNI